MNKPLSIGDCCQGSCCTNHGQVRDVLARRTLRSEYALFVKGTFPYIIVFTQSQGLVLPAYADILCSAQTSHCNSSLLALLRQWDVCLHTA